MTKKPRDLDGISKRDAVKSQMDMFTEYFKACIFEGIPSTAWKRQKCVLLPKVAKPLGERLFYKSMNCRCHQIGYWLGQRCNLPIKWYQHILKGSISERMHSIRPIEAVYRSSWLRLLLLHISLPLWIGRSRENGRCGMTLTMGGIRCLHERPLGLRTGSTTMEHHVQ